MSTPKRSAHKPRRSYHHGNLRRALIDQALATIQAEGVDALTLRSIGARIGVSRSALYRHFADKRALLTAVATEGFAALRQKLVSAWEEGGRDEAAFAALVRELPRLMPQVVTEPADAATPLTVSIAELAKGGALEILHPNVWIPAHGIESSLHQKPSVG